MERKEVIEKLQILSKAVSTLNSYTDYECSYLLAYARPVIAQAIKLLKEED